MIQNLATLKDQIAKARPNEMRCNALQACYDLNLACHSENDSHLEPRSRKYSMCRAISQNYYTPEREIAHWLQEFISIVKTAIQHLVRFMDATRTEHQWHSMLCEILCGHAFHKQDMALFCEAVVATACNQEYAAA